jgi:hypothetical protein
MELKNLAWPPIAVHAQRDHLAARPVLLDVMRGLLQRAASDFESDQLFRTSVIGADRPAQPLVSTKRAIRER